MCKWLRRKHNYIYIIALVWLVLVAIKNSNVCGSNLSRSSWIEYRATLKCIHVIELNLKPQILSWFYHDFIISRPHYWSHSRIELCRENTIKIKLWRILWRRNTRGGTIQYFDKSLNVCKERLGLKCSSKLSSIM